VYAESLVPIGTILCKCFLAAHDNLLMRTGKLIRSRTSCWYVLCFDHWVLAKALSEKRPCVRMSILAADVQTGAKVCERNTSIWYICHSYSWKWRCLYRHCTRQMAQSIISVVLFVDVCSGKGRRIMLTNRGMRRNGRIWRAVVPNSRLGTLQTVFSLVFVPLLLHSTHRGISYLPRFLLRLLNMAAFPYIHLPQRCSLYIFIYLFIYLYVLWALKYDFR
jgi:hypothetical protein